MIDVLNTVNVYAINVRKGTDPALYKQGLGYISAHKQKRIQGYVHAKDAERTYAADLLVRSIACQALRLRNKELVFAMDHLGKPYLCNDMNVHYNVSHTGEWVVCAASQCHPVGIDIERIRPIDWKAISTFFAEEEREQLHRHPDPQRHFYNLWTQKESYVKYKGTGLSEILSSFSVYSLHQCLFRSYDIDRQEESGHPHGLDDRQDESGQPYDPGGRYVLHVCSDNRAKFHDQIIHVSIEDIIRQLECS